MRKMNIRVDLTQLGDTIKVYSTAITEIQTAFDDLDSAINTLKSTDWKSGASKQYFATYDDSWKQNMKRQEAILEHLKNCLEEAKTAYENVYGKVHTLGQNI